MMDTVKLSIIHPAGVAEVAIPNNIPVKECILELASLLSLPLDSVVYRLDSKSLGRQLLGDETLESAKVPPDDRLILTPSHHIGTPVISFERGKVNPECSRILLTSSDIGLSLEGLEKVDARQLLKNAAALNMTLHSYRATLSELDDYKQELRKSKDEIERLNDKLKEKNIAAVLFFLGQVQIGFGTNLITNKSSGGWFVFLAGVALNLGALYFSIWGLQSSTNKSKSMTA